MRMTCTTEGPRYILKRGTFLKEPSLAKECAEKGCSKKIKISRDTTSFAPPHTLLVLQAIKAEVAPGVVHRLLVQTSFFNTYLGLQ